MGSEMERRTSILAAMFGVGVFALSAQVLFLREVLVAFSGNELSIGAVVGAWLIGVGGGALSARLLGLVFRGSAVQDRWLALLPLILSICLPLQVYGVRSVRLLLSAPAGTYAPFGLVLASSLLLMLPSSFSVGMFFPVAAARLTALTGALQDEPGDMAVSQVYTVDAAGSMVAGILLTYVLLPLFR